MDAGDMEVKFNLQTYLSEMREEQREDNKALRDKIDHIGTSLHKHDKRISVVENTRRLLLTIAGALGVAALGFIVDMAVNHLGK